MKPLRRKEIIASGIDIEPLTRKEIFAKGGNIEPLARDEMFAGTGGGGGSSYTPVITATFNTANVPDGYEAYLNNNATYIVDNKFFMYEGSPTINNGDTAQYVATFIENLWAGIELTWFASVLGSPDHYKFVPSDMVNCSLIEFDGDEYIRVTDPSKNASLTLTATLQNV